jgi:hypothetical protein
LPGSCLGKDVVFKQKEKRNIRGESGSSTESTCHPSITVLIFKQARSLSTLFVDLSMPPFVPSKQHYDKPEIQPRNNKCQNATQRKHHHHTNQSRSQPSISDQSLPPSALSSPTERITKTHHSRRPFPPRQTNQNKAVIRNGRFAHHISRHLRISCAVQPSKAGVLCVTVLQSGGRDGRADLSVSSGLLSQRACYRKAERESCRVGFVMYQMRLDVRTSRVGWALGMGTQVLRGVEFASSKGGV